MHIKSVLHRVFDIELQLFVHWVIIVLSYDSFSFNDVCLGVSVFLVQVCINYTVVLLLLKISNCTKNRVTLKRKKKLKCALKKHTHMHTHIFLHISLKPHAFSVCVIAAKKKDTF